MFFSVVIPTYNRKPILQKCLRAMENQVLSADSAVEGYEIVLVDDGSTDGTVEWIKEAQAKSPSELAHVVLYEQNHEGAAIARNFGVSETVIGLTLVAIGTSLPELATTVMAAFRKEADVALGNVIGSNMFNLLAIMGIATLVGPIPVPIEFLQFDLWVMLAASLLLIPIVYRNQRLGYRWGFFLSIAYIAYLIGILTLEV